jgi:arabinoxylan arabinofuranohydrolase
VFTRGGRDYILYHRHSIPFNPKFIGRQLCVDEINFTAAGLIEKITPTHEGPAFVRDRHAGRVNLAASAVATASSQADAHTGPARVLDDNYATLWASAKDDKSAWLQLDLGEEKSLASQELRFEYAWKSYSFTLVSSTDGQTWTPLADYTATPATGSPVVIDRPLRARYLRLNFVSADRARGTPGLVEWLVRP